MTVLTGEDTRTLPLLDDPGRAALFTGARTAYAFTDAPVADEELAAIWDLAKWPPTAANTQPLRVLYVRTDEGKRRLLPHLAEGNRPKASTAPVIAVLAVDSRFHEHLPTVMPAKPELRDAFEADEAMRERTGSFSGALQAGYFILAVRAAGLAAGPMGGFDAAGLDAEFFPDGRWRSVLVVNIGHPAEPTFDRMPRLAAPDAVRWA